MKASILALALAASPAWAIDVPSGQPISLQEVLVDQVGAENWLRFRFVAPDIARDGSGVNYAIAAQDMAHLCGTLALPYMDEYALSAEMIVISFANQEVEFGTANPEITQFFEAFRRQDGACIWEGL